MSVKLSMSRKSVSWCALPKFCHSESDEKSEVESTSREDGMKSIQHQAKKNLSQKESEALWLESVAVAFQIWMFDIFLLSQPLSMLLMSIILLYLLKAIKWASLGGSVLKFRGCQGVSKTGSVLDVWVPVELWQIYKGSLKGSASQLNDWVEML